MSLTADTETRTNGDHSPKDAQINRNKEGSQRETEGRRNRRSVTADRRRLRSSKSTVSVRRKVVRTLPNKDGLPSDDKNESLLTRTASLLRTSSKDLSKAASSIRAESGRVLESIRDSNLVRTLSKGSSSRKTDARSAVQKKGGRELPKRTCSAVLLKAITGAAGDPNVLEGERSEEITFYDKEDEVPSFEDPVMDNSQPERESNEARRPRRRRGDCSPRGSPRAKSLSRRKQKEGPSRTKSASRKPRRRTEQSVDKASQSARCRLEKTKAKQQVPETETSMSKSSRTERESTRLSQSESRDSARRNSMSAMDSTSSVDALVEEKNDGLKGNDSEEVMEKDSSDVVAKKRKPRSGTVKDARLSRSTKVSLRRHEAMHENDHSMKDARLSRSTKASLRRHESMHENDHSMDKSDPTAVAFPRSKGRVSMRGSASTLRKSLSVRGFSMVTSGQAQVDSVVSSLRENLSRSKSTRIRMSTLEKEDCKAVVPANHSEETSESVSNSSNSRERTVPVEKARTRTTALKMDSPRKKGFVEKASIQVQAKEISDRINRIQLSSEDEHHDSGENNPGQANPEASSSSPEDGDDDKIEVSPGEFAVVRSQEDVWDALLDGNYIISRCLSCSRKAVACSKAKFVRCPYCLSISPCFMSMTQSDSMQPFGVISGLRMEECVDMLLPKDARGVRQGGPSTPTINAVLMKSKKNKA